MSNSTHRAEVVPVVLKKHENADSLSIIDVYGYSVVGRTADWVGVEKGVYIPPDNLVDTKRPEFSFLAQDARQDGKARIKAKKLRGVISFGLLIPAPENAAIGDDLTEVLGIEHYDPAIHGAARQQGGLRLGGEVASGPAIVCPKYDLEAGRRYGKVMFEQGESVVITEKTHGANSRYVFWDGKIHVGSRTEWKKEYPSYDHLTIDSLAEKMGSVERAQEVIDNLRNKKPQKNVWWVALERHPEIREFCEKNPGVVVYAECYGAVQDLNYGHKKGEVSLAVFDLFKDGQFMSYEQTEPLREQYGLPWVPLVGVLSFDFDKVCELAEGPSLYPNANHIREGVVVRPVKERIHPRLGRTVLKWVSGAYLERSK